MSAEQELEAEFSELDAEVGEAVAEDAQDKDRPSPKLRPMLDAKFCLSTRCEVKENNKKLEARLSELKKKSGAQFQEIERLTAALKEGVTEDERRDALTVAAKDGYVQALKQENEALRTDLSERDDRVAELLKKAKRLRAQLDDYAGLIQTDEKLAQKFKQLRLAEERNAKLDAWYVDAKKKADQFFVDAEKARNEVVVWQRKRDEARAEYEKAKDLLRHAEELARKGFKVEAPKKSFFGGFKRDG